MFKLNLNLNDFTKNTLFKKAQLFRGGFENKPDAIREFYRILLNPIKGAHKSFGEDRSLVKLMSQKNIIHPDAWSHQFPGDEGYYRDIDAIKKALALKTSVVFDEYYRYSHDAKELLAFIQAQFNCTAGCNAYLSQKDGITFPIHRDAHDVLVFALSGEKRWQVFNERQDLNCAYNRVNSTLTDEAIIASGYAINEIMRPGDILYIPIGQYHCVENLTNHALHLTISMSFKPLTALLEDALNYINSANLMTLSDKSRQQLNQLHPVHQTSQPPSKEQLLNSLKMLQHVLNEVIVDDNFYHSQLQVNQNRHLAIFTTPTEEMISEILTCSE